MAWCGLAGGVGPKSGAESRAGPEGGAGPNEAEPNAGSLEGGREGSEWGRDRAGRVESAQSDTSSPASARLRATPAALENWALGCLSAGQLRRRTWAGRSAPGAEGRRKGVRSVTPSCREVCASVGNPARV